MKVVECCPLLTHNRKIGVFMFSLKMASKNRICRREFLKRKFIIIIMFLKGQVCFLFLDPQDEVGPSISFSVVLCSFVLLVYIVVLVLAVCLCPSSVRVVATFSGTVFISFTMFCIPVFLPNTLILFFIQFCYSK